MTRRTATLEECRKALDDLLLAMFILEQRHDLRSGEFFGDLMERIRHANAKACFIKSNYDQRQEIERLKAEIKSEGMR